MPSDDMSRPATPEYRNNFASIFGDRPESWEKRTSENSELNDVLEIDKDNPNLKVI